MLNYRAGLAASAIYNVNRGKKRQKMIQPLDFFGRKRRTAQGTEEISASLNLLYSSCKLNSK